MPVGFQVQYRNLGKNRHCQRNQTVFYLQTRRLVVHRFFDFIDCASLGRRFPDEELAFPPELQAVTKIRAKASAKTVKSGLSSFIKISFIDMSQIG